MTPEGPMKGALASFVIAMVSAPFALGNLDARPRAFGLCVFLISFSAFLACLYGARRRQHPRE